MLPVYYTESDTDEFSYQLVLCTDWLDHMLHSRQDFSFIEAQACAEASLCARYLLEIQYNLDQYLFGRISTSRFEDIFMEWRNWHEENAKIPLRKSDTGYWYIPRLICDAEDCAPPSSLVLSSFSTLVVSLNALSARRCQQMHDFYAPAAPSAAFLYLFGMHDLLKASIEFFRCAKKTRGILRAQTALHKES